MNRNAIKCVQNGDVAGLKRIISTENEDVDFITVCSKKSGDTIAILAARCGQLDVLKFVYTQCVTRVINGVPALPPLALE